MPAPVRPAFLILGRTALRGVEAGDGLHLEVFLEPELAPLTPVARLLVTSEGRGPLIGNAVQIDVAGAQPATDLTGTLHAAGRHVASQSVRRVVGDLDRVV